MNHVNDKTLFPADLDLPPNNQVLFISIFFGTLTLLLQWVSKANWARWATVGWFPFGLQWQPPQAGDQPVISERKGSVQVSPKVKLAIPILLDLQISLAYNCKVDLGS
jgi:hypothetical protein